MAPVSSLERPPEAAIRKDKKPRIELTDADQEVLESSP